MPVLAWANGGCANSSRGLANFLTEPASHGHPAVAIGPPAPPGEGGVRQPTSYKQLLEMNSGVLNSTAGAPKMPVSITKDSLSQPNGGEFARVALAWRDWQIKGDQTAAKMYTGPSRGLCADANWKIEKKRIP
ncbi:MAG TPA: hypothetical protein VLH09_07955 [Bryobacteraceae bacterium]|nr:hypothetical protein [Bryobacteraceae bacterium]